MSTRSTYRFRERFYDEELKKEVTQDVALVYVQCDGYPEGHPAETAEWLASGKAVNGIGLAEKKLIFNGIGCLAAQFIAKMKHGAGGTYLHNIRSRGKSGENYTYDVTIPYDKEYKPGEILFTAYDVNWSPKRTRCVKLWEGNPKDFKKFLERRKKQK